ncbi:hypothetical protein [Selenomonas flueggei]|nr:hypothetical protein [Selenomonas flueggei]
MKRGCVGIAASVLAMYLSISNIAHAETIVHNKRSVHHAAEQVEPRTAEFPAAIEQPTPKQQVKSVAPNEDTKQDTPPPTSEKNQSGEMMSSSPLMLPPAEKNPFFKLNIQDDFISYVSMYYILDNEQNKDLLITVEKQRSTTYLSSESYMMFKITDINNDRSNPPIFSKKHPPRLVFRKDGVEKIVAFQKVYMMNSEGVVYGRVRNSLRELVYASEVFFEVYREDEQYHRIHLPDQVIQQWKEVLESDLRKVKQEHLNR